MPRICPVDSRTVCKGITDAGSKSVGGGEGREEADVATPCVFRCCTPVDCAERVVILRPACRKKRRNDASQLNEAPVNDGLLPGSLLWRKDIHTGLVDHYGVVLALNPLRVAHIDKGVGGRLRIKRHDSFEEFAAGHAVTYERRTTPVPRDAMEHRITEIENSPPPFGLLAIGNDWNCESFARYISQGAPASSQATAAKGLLAVAVLGLAILNENGTSVDGNGYRRAKNGQFGKRRWVG